MSRRITIYSLSLFVLSGCASWEEEHRQAVALAAAHQWNKTIEQHHTQPTASGPKWQLPTEQAEIYVDYLEQLQDPETLLQVADVQACSLNPLTRSFVIHQQSPELVERQRQKTAKTVNVEQRGDTVTIIFGDCQNGELNGPVTALFTDDYYSKTEYFSGETKISGRIDGFFKNGQLHGEARVISIDRSNLGGSWRESTTLKIGVFDNGAQVGSHVTITGEGETQVITVSQALQDNYVRMNSWMSGQPNTRFHMLNGEIEGWLEFASSVLKDEPQCYRQGEKQLAHVYCYQVAPQIEQLMPIEAAAELPRLSSFDGIDDKPVTAASATAAAAATEKASHNSKPTPSAKWRIPQIGKINWLSLPNYKQLNSARAADYMPRLQQILADNIVQYLTPTAGNSCVLDDDTKSYLLYQLNQTDYATKRAKQRQRGMVYSDGQPKLSVTKGTCENGNLIGEFVVTYTYPQKFEMSSYRTSPDIYGRIEGSFVDGKLHGEVLKTWLTQQQPGTMAPSEVTTSLSVYLNGLRDGDEIQVIAIPQSRSTRLIKVTPYPEQRELAEIWLNGKRQLSSMLRHGVNDGFVTYHDPSLNIPPQCFRDGVQQNDNDYCEQISVNN
ncbi:hypothetical protein [Pseudidiomarina marina]|uniref:Lipoprotein n=1 Tax=Pseudidiomarina marina TaxID=502366 RepID=A0A432YJ44_9GAMM|nr:hypothetical protein [Pseudidiomarina marina]RUO60997.1 hypothetical protein CWI76_01605 [Pseudidiomarina marina]